MHSRRVYSPGYSPLRQSSNFSPVRFLHCLSTYLDASCLRQSSRAAPVILLHARRPSRYRRMSDSVNFFSAPAIAGAGVVALSAGGLGGAPYCALAVIASAPNDATRKSFVILDFISILSQWSDRQPHAAGYWLRGDYAPAAPHAGYCVSENRASHRTLFFGRNNWSRISEPFQRMVVT